MSMTVNLHGIDRAEAKKHGETQWLTFTNKDGAAITVFMPYDLAKEIADLINVRFAK